jgi:hypothetical protein
MLALRDDASSPAPPKGLPAVHDSARAERAILCAGCGAVVTTLRHRIAVNGAHEHRFMNPAGMLFHIGCFAEAIGCRIVGPDSHEYPWFPGHAWRYAMCAACGQHLGWSFRSGGHDGFFGLVLCRLRQDNARE